MTKLESVINAILENLKRDLAKTTWQSRCRYFNQMIKLAESLSIKEPCQELYDAFTADDKGSSERHSMHKRCNKLVDSFAETHAKNEHGILFHEPPFPEKAIVQAFFHNYVFPIQNDVPIDYLIVKASIEMKYLHLTNSTTGQYWHSWLDIRRYFHAVNALMYNEMLIRDYLRAMDIRLKNHALEEWKWKINRKAAHVLMKVANSGCYHWTQIHKIPCCKTPEIEEIRQDYIHSLQQKNFRQSTIDLYGYVFRNSIEFAGIETRKDIQALSPEKILMVMEKFSNRCKRRSMSTILPILRSVLKFFYTNGLTQRELSGIVMGGFTHRNSVAAYISRENQKKMIAQLEKEPKRTRAVIFLVLRLGLRDCDICHLTFQDIDWRHDKIRLIQRKTGEPLILPLLPEVGNAIMDYILNERPKRNDSYPYIFLRKLAPYDKLTSVYNICSNLFHKMEIKPENGIATGVHVFRYSLVHKLLVSKVPHQVIQDTLGHTSKESTKPYLSMEESMLRLCALDLSVIGSISWKGDSIHGNL